MNSLLQLLIYLLIGGAIVYVVFWILGMLAIDQALKNVIVVVVSILVLVWLLITFVPGLGL